MTDDDVRWRQDGVRHKWAMPYAPRWKRLPIIRRFRAIWHAFRVDRHNALHSAMGMIPTGYDDWILYGIARGFERETP